MMDKIEFTEAYAMSLHDLVKYYGTMNDHHFRSRLKSSIKLLIREYTDSFPVQYASEAAIDMVNNYIPGNAGITRWENVTSIYALHYKDHDFCNGPKGKPKLVLDHTTPVNEIRDKVLRCDSPEEIMVILHNYGFLCWITREEDNMLNNHGYRNMRPNGWTNCYQECGINFSARQG